MSASHPLSARRCVPVHPLSAPADLCGIGDIGERYSHCELSPLSQDTLHIDGTVVLQDNTLRDRETESGPADLPGTGLIDAVKALVDLVERVLRNADAGVFDTHIEVIRIRIDRHSHFTVIPVVFDRILDKIGDDHIHLDVIDLRVYFSHADHGQLNIPLLGDRPHPAQDHLDHLIDIRLFDVQLGILAVHADQRQKLRDDLVLPVHLILDVHHELSVHFHRDIILRDKRVRQNFHRSHGRFKFMGYVGNKFLPRLIQGIHARQDLVERVRYVLGLQECRRFYGICGISRLDGGNLSGKPLERFHQNSGKN